MAMPVASPAGVPVPQTKFVPQTAPVPQTRLVPQTTPAAETIVTDFPDASNCTPGDCAEPVATSTLFNAANYVQISRSDGEDVVVGSIGLPRDWIVAELIGRGHSVARRNEIRLHHVVQCCWSLGTVAGHCVVRRRVGIVRLHRANGDHVGVVARSCNRAVVLGALRVVPASVGAGLATGSSL